MESGDCSGWTPLFCAAKIKNEAVVKLLPEKGADLNSTDTKSKTPLFSAAEGGSEAVTQYLLNSGAIVNARESSSTQTPLKYAILYKNDAAAKLLLGRGAEPKFESRGQTLLLWAAEYGLEATVQLLLEKGIDFDLKDQDGRTLFSHAAENGHEAIVGLLLERGVDLGSKDSRGRTPLSWVLYGLEQYNAVNYPWKSTAALRGYTAILRLLLEKTAKLPIRDAKYGQLQLSLAAKYEHQDIVKLLISKGVSVNWRDADGLTPLMRATERGQAAIVSQLLRAGADIRTKSKQSITALELADRKDYGGMV